MSWTLRLGPELCVELDGRALGPAPNTTVAVLLVCLAANLGRPTHRTCLAAEIYPDSSPSEAANALRQSLLRLRKWLGDGAISCSGRVVELSPCAWTVTPDVLAGKKVEGGLLGGVIHPALEKHRRDWSEIPGGSLDDSAKAFVSAVSSIAPYDNFAARAIFVSGGSILSRVSLDDLRNLLHLTKPRTWDAPHALQYYEQEGFFRIREAWLSGVVSSFTRAFRIAERGRDQEGLARMASQVACGHIEIGEMEEAAYWLGKVRTGKNASSNLMIQTSRASFLWNDGHGDLALDTMNDARAYLPGADQASIARFWVNYSLLSAEVGGSDISERGTELTRPASPTVQSILEVARATQLASKGKLYDSIDILGQTLQTTLTLRHRMDAIYVEEALAEVLARAGRSSEAKNTWLSAQAKRSAKLNPRNLARYRRIRSLCS